MLARGNSTASAAAAAVQLSMQAAVPGTYSSLSRSLPWMPSAGSGGAVPALIPAPPVQLCRPAPLPGGVHAASVESHAPGSGQHVRPTLALRKLTHLTGLTGNQTVCIWWVTVPHQQTWAAGRRLGSGCGDRRRSMAAPAPARPASPTATTATRCSARYICQIRQYAAESDSRRCYLQWQSSPVSPRYAESGCTDFVSDVGT